MRWLFCTLLLIFGIAGCVMPHSQASIAPGQIKHILADEGVGEYWLIEQEEVSDGYSSGYIYVYETPISIDMIACATNVRGFGLDAGGSKVIVVDRQTEWLLSIKKCDIAELEDFRPVVGSVSENDLLKIVSTLSSAVPLFGGNAAEIIFESPEIEDLFATASVDDIAGFSFDYHNNVVVRLSVDSDLAKTIGVRVSGSLGEGFVIYVYWENVPYIIQQ